MARRSQQCENSQYKRIAAKPLKIKPHDWDHICAFQVCIAETDKFLRRATAPEEVATLVAEDVEHMRKFLRRIMEGLKRKSHHLGPEYIRQDVTDIRPELQTFGTALKVEKIIDCAHFAAKQEAPLLQIADACAFTIRRWINNQTRGDDLMKAMLGDLPVISDYSGPLSAGWWNRPPPPLTSD